MSDFKRDMALVEQPLRAVFRSLVKGQASWPLFLHGNIGAGKTYSALALSDYTGGFYYTAAGLAEDMIQSARGALLYPGTDRAVWPKALWAELTASVMVILDELGTRDSVSDHHYDCVKRLVDVRAGKPLVVISNLGVKAIGELYDSRLASRLAAGTDYAMRGPDRRLEGK